MAILYRIKPVDKKSVEAFYDVYKKMPDGTIRGWNVTEMYRWGQGFVEDESELPFSDDRYHCVDPTIGWGCELEDLCAVDFEFDDSFTEEEKEEMFHMFHEHSDIIKKLLHVKIPLVEHVLGNPWPPEEIINDPRFEHLQIKEYNSWMINAYEEWKVSKGL